VLAAAPALDAGPLSGMSGLRVAPMLLRLSTCVTGGWVGVQARATLGCVAVRNRESCVPPPPKKASPKAYGLGFAQTSLPKKRKNKQRDRRSMLDEGRHIPVLVKHGPFTRGKRLAWQVFQCSFTSAEFGSMFDEDRNTCISSTRND